MTTNAIKIITDVYVGMKSKGNAWNASLRHSCFQYFFEVVESGKCLEKGVI